jgi:hypothetical protein
MDPLRKAVIATLIAAAVLLTAFSLIVTQTSFPELPAAAARD